ncbi:xanthine dehydrogenase molybdopterin binding subunit [Thalassotalea euphylliae]|uniref:Xanthine dehydrogenase molybdopterin binding subunit n=1 Tax=Thalassotalea euphylliae TaxID=1655234 RepID=A0A3E0TUI2_9GAMM|nr:xanthine dehydrogenase molybdopterin binding subunit [Thalassotalea euphylliae]REL27612.1 xanthine dehydrogenase molybdopterin binding subunit [Thalassotalea euphylliae]
MRHFEIAQAKHASKPQSSSLGHAKHHDSAIKQVCGSANYIDDNAEPAGCLHAYPVTAPFTRGVIKRIDTSKAQALAGVKRILSASDVPGKIDIGPIFEGDLLLASDTIEFHHQPVLLVVADSYETARRAARLVEFDYQAETAVTDIETAIEQQAWVRPPHALTRGDAKAAIANASHQLRGEMHIGGQEHFYLEGQVSMAQPNGDGGIFVQCSTQHPTEVQHLIAKVLKQPFHFVTVEMRRMGGGFGGKETQAAPWACLAALASYHLNCAVKIRLARADDFRLTGKRHPFFNRYQVGFDEQGVIAGADIEVNGYCGYSPDLSDAIVDRAMFHADNAYYYPAAKITGNRCKVNTVSHTAFRGFGGPQGMMVAEQIVDDIAATLGKDPLTVRKANLYRQSRSTTPYHQEVEQHALIDMIEQVEQEAEYWQRKAQIKAFNQVSPIIKQGLALTPVKFGISFTVQHLNQAGALVNIYSDGSIHLNHGGTEMGQGLNTKVAQVVAHAFGVDLERVGITATRTDKVPNTSPTAASSGSDLNGMAALNAANTIKARLSEFIANHFSVEQGTIRFSDNKVYHDKGELSFDELASLAYLNRISLSSTGYYATPKIHYDRQQAKGRPFFYYAHGVALTQVEIDTLTGENTVTRVDILHDVGHSLNPALDIGQIEGAFIQGMGWLTTEDLVWNKQGQLASFNPATYKIPAIGDTPAQFNVNLYQSANPEASVFRSKAVGEPPFMLAISVWSAIRDAISSVADYQINPRLDTPATPERVLAAVQQAQAYQQAAKAGAAQVNDQTNINQNVEVTNG